MPRLVSVDLGLHLAGNCTTMAPCFKLARLDGVEYFWTGHDENLTIGGDLYQSDLSFSVSNTESKSGLSVDNAELTLPLSDVGISKGDVVANLFYRAELDVF